MTNIQNFIDGLIEKSEVNYDNFEIEEITSISKITEDAYLEKPTWIGGDTKFVCLFIDLNKSSKTSFKKHPKTMAKIYDYFTQNLVNVFNDYSKFKADYIDIKGDGAFAIYEGDKASYKAFYAAITFKELFDQKISSKFTDDEGNKLSCKIGIHKDKLLVKKIGKRGNYNEVWAGRLVNNAAKLSDKSKNISEVIGTKIIISNEVYDDFVKNPEYGLYSCHNTLTGEYLLDQKIIHFIKVDDNEETILGKEFYYATTGWCSICADNYINKL